jgi:ABC-type antimicrobial peptide transport system permease subunit
LAVEVSSVDRDPGPSVRAFRAFADELREEPDVQLVSGGTFSLLGPMGGLWEVAVPPEEPVEMTWAHVVLPDYFETLGIPLRAGRDFSWTDDLDTPATVVISESLARRLFGAAEPVGRELTMSDERLARVTVVGVAADTLRRTEDGRFVASPAVYISYLQRPWLSSMVFAVRYRDSPVAAANAVRDAARTLGSSITLVDVSPLPARISSTLVEPRFYSFLLTAFSLTALLIVVVGVYATLSFIVAGRQREVGIRVALGASRAHILTDVLRYGVGIVGAGLAAGLPMAVYGSRSLEGLVTGIEPGGISAYVVTAVVLLAAGGVAALGPALRAVRIEPLRVLSSDC